jgi:His/Glu/Gln/Arg/opine family amino acid ABC transporter permease subunit
MTTMQDRRATVVNQAYYDEPAVKPPPMLVTGPLAWIRKNLFGSRLDTLLTILGTLLIVGATTSFVDWSIRSANWFAVTYNLRLFMIGRVEPFMEGRIFLLVLIISLIIGVNLAVWARIPVRAWITLAVIAALLFILPAAFSAFIPLPQTYLSAGQVEIVSGSITEKPRPLVGFIARAGETITLRAETDLVRSDAQLATMNSFTDRAADAVRNAANNRLTLQARLAQLERLLAGDTLTARQREAYTQELSSAVVPEPITDTLAVNAAPISVRILSSSFEPLAEATLTPDSEPLNFVVPANGWYLLEKAVIGSDTSYGLLAVHGIYPIFERNFLQSITTESGQASSVRVNQYTRAMDNFIVEGGRPRIDGEDVPMIGIIEHQYKGARTFADYLVAMLGPFLNQLSQPLPPILITTAAGYAIARFVDRRWSPPEKPRARSRRLATWLWVALPVIAFILIAGFAPDGPLKRSDPQLWGGLLLTMMLTAVGIVAAFPIGIGLALGRRSSLPVVSTFSTLYIELVRGVPLVTVLFMSMLLVPFVIPSLGGPDTAPYRAMVAVTLFSAAYLAENVRGGLQSLPPGQEEAAKALGLPGWQITLYITLPQALRAVIPALVGQFIALYKDTSLVAIVGLIDLTGVTRSVAAQTEFQGVLRETYVFISIVYFIFSYVISIVSRRIEASGSGAARRV